MYERLETLYNEGRLNESGLANAVTKLWITQEEYDQIVLGE